ncbi:CLUMA_CG021049, isoform A [Clunio marinus]|uniref:CLUMA_CG021049, isoform A n=1 Tax=Clunio marinus TaxID=568069 RepID=A0A1J1J6A0_9DIPT|nr:CLUMA_CG021049, isoform A [Clunio marinus]
MFFYLKLFASLHNLNAEIELGDLIKTPYKTTKRLFVLWRKFLFVNIELFPTTCFFTDRHAYLINNNDTNFIGWSDNTSID